MSNIDTRWKKGQSGNPKGRPMLNEELVEACRKNTKANLVVLEQIRDAKSSKPSEKNKAIEMLLERGYGKAIQPTKELQANESYSDFLDAVMGEPKHEQEKKKK